jgi:hypothetical protein
MTLQQQLESYLAGETLTLPAGALATAGIQTVIEEFYAGGQLVINQAVLTANATGTTVTIAGASSLIAVTAMPVTAVFETTGTGLILTLTAVPPADWKFSRSFTSLAGSFYDQLTLSGSSLVLSSADQSSPLPLAAGLNYAGNIGAGLPVPLSLLLTGPVALAGAIQIDHGVPAMTLAITPAIMLGMGSLTLPAVDCALTSAATQIANDNGSTWISSNSLTFQSTLSIGAKTVSVAGAYAITTESLDIEVVNQSISLADGLQDVFALVNYTPAIAWPAAFNLNNIYLSNIGLSISFEPSVTLDNFSFGVAWNTAWDVIPGVVTLNKIDVNIWISSPFASATRQYGGQIYGQFLLGAKSNTIFDIYATIPTSRTKQGWTFAGYTQPGAVLAIGSVAADFCARFGIALPDVLQKFTLKNLYLGLNPADSSVNGYFTLDFAIGATPIEITINAALSKSGTQYGVVVSGQLTIGGSVFSVALNASAGATTFSASWRSGQSARFWRHRPRVRLGRHACPARGPRSRLDRRRVLLRLQRRHRGAQRALGAIRPSVVRLACDADQPGPRVCVRAGYSAQFATVGLAVDRCQVARQCAVGRAGSAGDRGLRRAGGGRRQRPEHPAHGHAAGSGSDRVRPRHRAHLRDQAADGQHQ